MISAYETFGKMFTHATIKKQCSHDVDLWNTKKGLITYKITCGLCKQIVMFVPIYKVNNFIKGGK
jgi:hypothetical protein